MKSQKLFVILLTALIIAPSVLVSCGRGDVIPDETAPVMQTQDSDDTETTADPEPDLPDTDLEGGDFTFLIRAMSAAAYGEKYVWREEYDGEVVNDAIIDRNRAVEEKFNCALTVIQQEEAASEAQKLILAGDDSFRAIYERKNALTSLAPKGFLADIGCIPYLTLDAVYWDKNASEQLKINNKLFFMPSDISMGNLGGAYFLYFNKKLISDYNLEDPYALYDSDKWTLDAFIGMAKKVSTDLDGDGKITPSDRWGMMTYKSASNGNVMHMYIGIGGRFSETGDDGRITLAFNNDRTAKYLSVITELMTNTEYSMDYQPVMDTCVSYEGYPHKNAWARSLFCSDHYLFTQIGATGAVEFANMESDFGIMPNPKLDESQDEYGHKVDIYATILAVPVTNADSESTGAVLEYMAYLSNKTVLPAYYETTIQAKKLRDDKSIEIINRVKATIRYDIAELFIGSKIGEILESGVYNGDFASKYAANEAAMQSTLDSFFDSFE